METNTSTPAVGGLVDVFVKIEGKSYVRGVIFRFALTSLLLDLFFNILSYFDVGE
jgi:hypothetical protein